MIFNDKRALAPEEHDFEGEGVVVVVVVDCQTFQTWTFNKGHFTLILHKTFMQHNKTTIACFKLWSIFLSHYNYSVFCLFIPDIQFCCCCIYSINIFYTKVTLQSACLVRAEQSFISHKWKKLFCPVFSLNWKLRLIYQG